MAALVIPIHDLDSSGKDFVFALDASWLKQAFGDGDVRGDESKPGSAEVHAQRNGREILVHGRAHAWLVTECGRCLKDITLEVECDLAALYAPAEPGNRRTNEDEDLEIDPDEPDREFYSGDQVVIDDLVRDYLMLEVPMQPRCEEDCEMPKAERSAAQPARVSADEFGEDKIDPRLMPLKKLAQSEPDKE